MVIDSMIYISGFNGFVDTGEDQYFMLYCLDMEGEVVWNTSYGDPVLRESFPSLCKTPDGNLMLFGDKFRNTEPDHWVCKLIKVDLQGNVLWEQEFGWQFDWNIRINILPHADSTYTISYIKCDIDTICSLTSQGGVTRLNSEGEEVWSVTFPASMGAPSQPYVAQMDGDLVAAYWQQNVDFFMSDPAHYFIDSMGAIVDTQLLFDLQGRFSYGLAEAPGRGIVGVGTIGAVIAPPLYPQGVRVYLINNEREMEWERMYADTSFDSSPPLLYNAIPTRDGGFAAIGLIANRMTGVLESHNWLLKLDSMGCLVPGCSDNTIITDAKEAVFLQAEGVRVWPNPASQWVSAAFPPEFRHDARDLLLLLSAEGRLLRSVPVQGDVEHLLLPPELPEGVFYLALKRGNEVVFSKKLLRQ